jgi:hypothetical protein
MDGQYLLTTRMKRHQKQPHGSLIPIARDVIPADAGIQKTLDPGSSPG